MPIRSNPWPAGTPCWVDLGAPDVRASTAFYGAVLGWTFFDSGEEFGQLADRVKQQNILGKESVVGRLALAVKFERAASQQTLHFREALRVSRRQDHR